MAKLFQKKSDEDLRIKRLRVFATAGESETIKRLAKIRNLNVSTFMLRAALGRRADVDHETEIVLALIDYTRSIRELHATFIGKGVEPPEALLKPAIQDAKEAMLRITK